MDNNNNNSNTTTASSRRKSQHSDPWAPPPYTTEQERPQPYNPDDIQVSSSPFAPRPARDSKYAFLAEFDTVFLVDDSSSMAGSRWDEAEEAIAMITPVCTQYDPDGIDLYFLNHRNPHQQNGGYENITSPNNVQDIFRRVQPSGATPVGQRLRQILSPYLRRVQRMERYVNDYGQPRNPEVVARPMNIIVITDGVFTDDAESVILDVARTLDRQQAIPWQVGIQFFQIGMDKEAQKYLQQLDDELGKAVREGYVRDIVDTVPWKGQLGQRVSGEGILKVVLGAVNKKLDRQKV